MSLLRWVIRAVLVARGIPKTLVFNLRYFPIRDAVRVPVLVSHRVALFQLGGSVTIRGPVRPAMVLLGFGEVGAFDFKRSRSIWHVTGSVVFDGPARLGNGFKIANGGEIRFGDGFVLSAESQIVARAGITFGEGCLISFGVLIIDSDYHKTLNEEGVEHPTDAPIVLGRHVWVGARSTILKGVELGDDVIVGAGAVVTRSELRPNVLIGGNPARILREGVRWRH